MGTKTSKVTAPRTYDCKCWQIYTLADPVFYMDDAAANYYESIVFYLLQALSLKYRQKGEDRDHHFILWGTISRSANRPRLLSFIMQRCVIHGGAMLLDAVRSCNVASLDTIMDEFDKYYWSAKPDFVRAILQTNRPISVHVALKDPMLREKFKNPIVELLSKFLSHDIVSHILMQYF